MLSAAAVFGPVLASAPALHAQEQNTEKLPAHPDAAGAPEPGHQQEDPLFPMKGFLWFQQQRAYPYGHIPAGAYWRAQTQKRALMARHAARLRALAPAAIPQADPFSSVTWTADGPQPAADYYGTTPYSGRATSVAVDPTDPGTVYLGTAAGGVWKTTDGGNLWKPLTDNQASLAIGAVAVDPNNPNIVFAGTGEPDYSTDSYYGQGLLKSTDGGATWTLIRSPFTSGDTAPPFTEIAVQPGNSNIVLAANLSGLYRSADGGTTWSNVLNAGSSAGVTAVLFNVKSPGVAYAGIGGFSATATASVYMSTDAGQTWKPIPGTGAGVIPLPSAVIRTALAEDSTGTTLYAAFANSDFATPGVLWSTTNSGASWTQLTPPGGLDWYRNAIAVDPANSQVLYATGANLYESIDGGKTWAANNGGVVYADEHAFAFAADGSRMYVADDGGVFVTTEPATLDAAFSSLNTTLNTMTFYPGFSLFPGVPHSALAGAQDHGVELYKGDLAWANGEQSGFCGDAGSVYIDPKGEYAYAHCEGGPPNSNWVSNATADANTGAWVAAQTGIGSTDRMPWVADIKGDQLTVSTVYTATNYLYQSTNNAASWTSISPDLTAGNSTVTTIAVSPTDSNTIYTGAGDGTVSLTTNALSAAPAWTTLSGLPNRSISKIVVAPDSPKDVYLTVSGFDSPHVFHSTSGGTTWASITGDLPNTPADSILLDPSLLNTIYLATDTGVYVTTNGGTNWVPLGQGLPNVVVQDLLMDTSSRTLRVITHGRGAWDAILPLQPLQSSALSLTFPSQTQGTTSATQTITLTNDLTGNLSLNPVTITGPFTQTTTCGKSLASGATCKVNVAFAPTTAGALQGTLVVSSADNTITVALSGTGVGIPNAVLGASGITFAAQPVGIVSAGQTVELNNSGDAPLSSIAISIGGANAADFGETSTCGSSLAAGGSCAINIVFKPTATGTRGATLSIADSAAGSPQTVVLTGTGAAPFSLSATSTTATVTRGSSATYQLAVSAAQGSALAGAVTLSCSGLPALSNCTFKPATVPAGATSQNVTLTIATTATTTSALEPLSRKGGFALAALSILSLLFLPRRHSRLWLVAMAILMIGIPGCGGGGGTSSTGGTGGGGGGKTNPGTPAGSYTVTVTAAQAATYQTTQALTLTVQQ